MIELTCPACRARIGVRDTAGGQTLFCPKCGHAMAVPEGHAAAGPSPSPPPLPESAATARGADADFTVYPAPYPGYDPGPVKGPGQSGLGIASFIVALAGLVTLGGTVAWGAYAVAEDPTILDAPEEAPEAMLLGFLFIAGAILTLVGAALGIAGVAQRRRGRGLAAAGLTISLILIALIVVLMLIGDEDDNGLARRGAPGRRATGLAVLRAGRLVGRAGA